MRINANAISICFTFFMTKNSNVPITKSRVIFLAFLVINIVAIIPILARLKMCFGLYINKNFEPIAIKLVKIANSKCSIFKIILICMLLLI